MENEKISILNRIKDHSELKKLTQDEYLLLADEIRAKIIDTVSHTGGHLASNLGVIELSIALHSVFDTPKDKIIWDVSHQCYPHKLLTGRADEFDTLRKHGGLSGFTKRDESDHDAFGAGHASTSISAALGFAKARDLTGDNYHVVAVIGDGSMTGGMALEGINNASSLDTDVVVVLNDNKMSISENVGALSLHFAKLRMAPFYQRVETKAKEVVEKYSKAVANVAEGVAHGVVRLFGSKSGAIFEEMGFTYIGPIDGHNIETMKDVFESVKTQKGAVLVHVVTTKGKGYEFAENNATYFHGISAFNVLDGKIEKKHANITFTDEFSDAMIELAAENKKIVAITAAMPDGTGLTKFAKLYPDRFFDVGIAEGHAVTFAAGLASSGVRPVVALYSTFVQRAFDQIIHDVCLQKLPVVFAIDRAGLVGEDGPTHHGVFDLAFLREIPNLIVAAPRNTMLLRDMLASAFEQDMPMAIRYPRGASPVPHVDNAIKPVSCGKGEIVLEGKDIIIFAVGPMVYSALAAAKLLESKNISAEIIDPIYIKPLDCELIEKVLMRNVPIVTVEDGILTGGFGSAILDFAARKNISVRKILCIGIPDEFVEHGACCILKEKYNLTAEGIFNKICKTLGV